MSHFTSEMNRWYSAHVMQAGKTPLIVAALEGHIDIVRALLRAGADPCASSMVGDILFDSCHFQGRHYNIVY
jgi:ankyrin repeat protein